MPRSLLCLLAALLMLTPASASVLPQIANPGFEETAAGNDAFGWGWQCGAAAGFHSDTSNPHGGKRCVEFYNNSSLAPNVYARLYQGIGVLPGVEYELAVWVRGEDVAPGQHFTDWNSYTLNLPSGTFGWQKVSVRFRTRSDQAGLNLGINVVNTCKSLAIDDVSLTPIGAAIRGGGVTGSVLVQGRVSGDNKPASVAFMLKSSMGEGAKLSARISAGDITLLDRNEPVPAGESTIEMQCNSGSVLARKLLFSYRVTDGGGKTVAEGSRPIEKLSSGVLLAEIDKVEKRLNGEFMSLYRQCAARGIPLDYPAATRTMLEQFIPLERQDAQKNEERRADFAIGDFSRALDESIAAMRAYLADPKAAPVVPRYQSGSIKIDGLSLIGPRRDSKGKTDRGPLFFCGYGHFSQARIDIPRWPGYGVNLIQSAEFGPSAIFPEEDKTDLTAAHQLVKTLDEAAKHNVKVDFLISPHYFPDWARAKWPNLNHAGFAFCIDEPEGRYIVEKFLRLVVPMIKNKPALASFCLTNEPAFDRPGGCPLTKPLFVSYLKGLYGDVKALNAAYGTDYKDFEAVPVGGGFDDSQFYDYCMFNKKRFAAWHQWMADVIHEMMPDAVIHAKECVILDLPSRIYSPWGVDIEMFSKFSQLNGNDCYIMPSEGLWAIGWHLQNLTLDLQRSMGRKPVFDSEHHLQPDGSTSYVPPEHYKTALWQGAVHGQGMSTQWVWERAGHPSFYGNVMDRPGCALATGTTCMDLNRFAREVTALQVQKAPAAILYSKASFMKDAAYVDAMNRSYEALNFCGVKVDFISENQLAAGKSREYTMIVLPQSTHLPAESFRALCGLPDSTRLVIVGDPPKYDPYHKLLSEAASKALAARSLCVDGGLTSEKLWPVMRSELSKLGAMPAVSVVDAKTGRPVWGVEWLPAKVGGATIVNMVNLTSKPVDVTIVAGGKPVRARDLLSLLGRELVGRLKPITPVLAEVVR